MRSIEEEDRKEIEKLIRKSVLRGVKRFVTFDVDGFQDIDINVINGIKYDYDIKLEIEERAKFYNHEEYVNLIGTMALESSYAIVGYTRGNSTSEVFIDCFSGELHKINLKRKN